MLDLSYHWDHVAVDKRWLSVIWWMTREAQNRAKEIIALHLSRIARSAGRVTALGKQCCQVWYTEHANNFFFQLQNFSFWGNHTVFICGFALGNGCQHSALLELALRSVYSCMCVLCLFILLDTTISFSTTNRDGINPLYACRYILMLQ